MSSLSTYLFCSLKEAGFPVTLLPIVAAPGSRAGSLQYDWCGIPVGTPVLVGLGDVQCAARSTLSSESDAGNEGLDGGGGVWFHYSFKI